MCLQAIPGQWGQLRFMLTAAMLLCTQQDSLERLYAVQSAAAAAGRAHQDKADGRTVDLQLEPHNTLHYRALTSTEPTALMGLVVWWKVWIGL